MPIALSIILLSTIVISGTGYTWIRKQHQPKKVVLDDTKNAIKRIIQTGPHRDHLITRVIAEILGLSSDQPVGLKNFKVKQSEQVLRSLPMIQDVKLKCVRPDILYIDYVMRRPLAMLLDVENAAVDEEGHAFPFAPFYSPKSLPEIYLGLPGVEETFYQEPIHSESFSLAVDVLKLLKKVSLNHRFQIKRVDVSKAFHKSLGQREIVVQIKNQFSYLQQKPSAGFFYTLRLSPNHYPQSLGNYLILHKELTSKSDSFSCQVKEDERVIDLRLKETAFIEEIAKH